MDRADGGQHPLHEPAYILHGEKINNPANDVNSKSSVFPIARPFAQPH